MAADICRRLDGLALAIELAATRVDVFGIGGLAKQLDDRFRLLTGHRAGPERHHTLTATIDWSYDLLSGDEQTLIRRLSTFAGAFSLESACAVAADGVADHPRKVEDLTSLVAKSLIAADTRDGKVEYRLLDTMRSYELDKLAVHNDLEDARRRHAQHLLDVSERAEEAAEQLSRTECWRATARKSMT